MAEDYSNPQIDWSNVDLGGINLGNFGFGGSQPLQSFPTAQPVQAVPYFETPALATEFTPPDRTYGYDPVEPASTAAPAFDFSDYKPQYLLGQSTAGTDALNKFIADQAAAGKEYVSLNPYQGSGLDAINANIWNAFNPVDPNNPAASAAEVVRFDTGNKVGVPNAAGGWDYRGSAPVAYQPGENYILTDASGKNVLGNAASAAELQALSKLADAQKYGWSLYQADEQGGYTPGTQLFRKDDTRPSGVLGALVNYGLPIGVGLLTGGVGALPSLGAGTTAGIMGATGLVSGILGGKSIGDALLQGAITGGTAGLLKAPVLGGGKSVGSVIGSALNKVPVVGDALQTVNKTLGLGGAPGSSYFDPTGGITVTAGQSANPLLTGALSSALGTGLLNDAVLKGALTSGYTPPAEVPLEQQFDDVLVKGSKLPIENLPVAPVVGADTSGTYDPGLNEIKVTADRPVVENTAPVAGAVAGAGTYDPGLNEIKVTAKPKPPSVDETIASVVGSVAPTLVTPLSPPQTSTPTEEEKKGGAGSTIGKIVGGLTIADALAKIIGKIAGGGSGTKSPAGQDLQNVFSAKLPRATGIFAPENLAPRDMSGTDWYRYGYGPEKAFFQNVPTSAAERTALTNAYRPSQLPLSGTGGMTQASSYSDPAAMLNKLQSELAAAGISDADFNAYLQTPEGQQALLAMLGGTGFAKGGSTPMRHAKRVPSESFAVQGPGTGRSDEIPAVLSDGEYVIDAETVALLGDGSSKAGAKKLDEFRVNVRKHKGRNLAKGKFSVNAKRPEKYLSGGRT